MQATGVPILMTIETSASKKALIGFVKNSNHCCGVFIQLLQIFSCDIDFCSFSSSLNGVHFLCRRRCYMIWCLVAMLQHVKFNWTQIGTWNMWRWKFLTEKSFDEFWGKLKFNVLCELHKIRWQTALTTIIPLNSSTFESTSLGWV